MTGGGWVSAAAVARAAVERAGEQASALGGVCRDKPRTCRWILESAPCCTFAVHTQPAPQAGAGCFAASQAGYGAQATGGAQAQQQQQGYTSTYGAQPQAQSQQVKPTADVHHMKEWRAVA